MGIIDKQADEKKSTKNKKPNDEWNKTSSIQKFLPGLIFFIILILALGVGGWFVSSQTISVKSTRLKDESGALVLINQTFLSKGDVIKNIRILDITKRGVVIESNGQKHALQIGETFNPFLEKLFRNKRITLRGTLFDENGDILALLNKKLIQKGEDIRGVHILEIDNHSIVIESNGVKRRLQIGESFSPDKE